MNILITGATGFLGKYLLSQLNYKQNNITVVLRSTSEGYNNSVCVPIFNGESDFKRAVVNQDIIIHCAARVHVMNVNIEQSLKDFREVNTHATINLAQQAAEAGVKRFIFISSIKVNGESTELGSPFKPDDIFVPTDPYGLSKHEAEVGLRNVSLKTGMEVVIIRPPLVYGPGVKANFASMIKWINKGLPLPLGGIKDNKRSLVSVDNLVDLIITCIDHPDAANQTFLVSDNADVSTTALLGNMAEALNVPNRLIPIPPLLFDIASQLIGKPAISQRLCGSLQVNISKTIRLLNWSPPYSSAESMKKTADAFIDNLNKKK
ncbi:UDP-glucose 4-epimerase family protein [Colwellia psychrerythraea]|uniref:NAD-dependent epimerase/dehydratase n=1 Tax=Colwellia psychrerythraea TaxID=28229 RepID=A0A099KIT1_COLPS|nr:SDR family oxidoreductase [Colwellia psychrerythraea]KGJ89902.1 NAD-dependent epimerase/dehydratase [Colwellia psychrerythraea]